MNKLIIAVLTTLTLCSCARLPGADSDANWGGALNSMNNGIQNMRQAARPNVPFPSGGSDCTISRVGNNQYRTSCN